MRSLKRFSKSLIFVILSTLALYSSAQTPTYSCLAKNDTLLNATTYQFDVYIYRTGTTELYLNNFQLSFQASNSAAILNGGVLSGIYVSGSTELPSPWSPGGVTVFNSTNPRLIRINGPSATSNGTLIPESGLRIGTFQIFNTVAYAHSTMGLIWWNTNPAYTTIYAIVPPGVTGTATLITNFSWHTSSFTNPVLNMPVTAFNLTGGSTYCSGSAGVAVGLSGSENGVEYRLIKNSSPAGAYIPGTGAAITFGVQTFGDYSSTGYRKATYLTGTMTGSLTVTQITTPLAPGSITGPSVVVQGQTGVAYSVSPVPNATGYVWSLPAGCSIVSGANTNSITVDFSATASSGNMNVYATNDCGNGLVSPNHFIAMGNLGYSINGIFTYNNSVNTPLDSLWVVLKQNNVRIDSIRTDLTGSYFFTGKTDGVYTLSTRTSKIWDGVNSTDAVKIQRHFAGLELITIPIRLTAADVNNSNSINATDAIQVKRRFAGLQNYFARGDWTFEKITGGDTVIINGASVTQNFYGLCVGDVNGSYVPAPGAKLASGLVLEYTGSLKIKSGQVFEYPLSLDRSADVSAISLNLLYRNDLVDILEVKTSRGEVAYATHGAQLKIAWSEIEPLLLEPQQELLIIKMRLKGAPAESSTSLISLLPGSELADAEAIPIENAVLKAPYLETSSGIIVTDETFLSGLSVYPNPANNQLWVSFELAEAANVSVTIYSMLGPVLAVSDNPSQSTGQHKLSLDVSRLSPGVYMVKFVAKGPIEFTSMQRIVINR